LKTLEETGQLDNTFLVFTSDNGYFWGEHHLGDKRWAYEESLRIPMLMRYPKRIKAGSKISQMVMNVDMAPTMLDLVGVAAPKEVQGRSILPLFKGSVKNWRTAFLSEYFMEPQYHASRAGGRCAMSAGNTYFTELAGMDGCTIEVRSRRDEEPDLRRSFDFGGAEEDWTNSIRRSSELFLKEPKPESLFTGADAMTGSKPHRSAMRQPGCRKTECRTKCHRAWNRAPRSLAPRT
jgi:arylsulfatase A-like enzyme